MGCNPKTLKEIPKSTKKKGKITSMEAVIFIAAIVGITVAYFAAKEFELIAKEKGYTSKKYFWWTFLVGFIGIPMVIALPDRRGSGTGAASANLPVNDDEIPEI